MELEKILGSKVKISILYQLWKSKNEGKENLFERELAKKVNFSPAGISKAGKDLKETGLIEIELRGKMKFYELVENSVTEKLVEFFEEWEKKRGKK